MDCGNGFWTPDLPAGWQSRRSRSHGGIYYHHLLTGKTQWNHPAPQNILPPPFDMSHNKILSGCIICSTGLAAEPKSELAQLVTAMGGRYEGNLTTEVTHLMALATGGQKYDVAVARNLPVVTPEWVRACWDASERLQLGAFGLQPPAPLADAHAEVLDHDAHADVLDHGVKRRRDRDDAAAASASTTAGARFKMNATIACKITQHLDLRSLRAVISCSRKILPDPLVEAAGRELANDERTFYLITPTRARGLPDITKHKFNDDIDINDAFDGALDYSGGGGYIDLHSINAKKRLTFTEATAHIHRTMGDNKFYIHRLREHFFAHHHFRNWSRNRPRASDTVSTSRHEARLTFFHQVLFLMTKMPHWTISPAPTKGVTGATIVKFNKDWWRLLKTDLPVPLGERYLPSVSQFPVRPRTWTATDGSSTTSYLRTQLAIYEHTTVITLNTDNVRFSCLNGLCWFNAQDFGQFGSSFDPASCYMVVATDGPVKQRPYFQVHVDGGKRQFSVHVLAFLMSPDVSVHPSQLQDDATTVRVVPPPLPPPPPLHCRPSPPNSFTFPDSSTTRSGCSSRSKSIT
jgi:hypothetical protein